MKLISVPPNENYVRVHHISQNKIWEMGFRDMIFGTRVAIGKFGVPLYSYDICAGPEIYHQYKIYTMVYNILEMLPEEINEKDLVNTFPIYKIRPVVNDSEFMEKLHKLVYKNGNI